jgi:leucyl aminopeptidase
MTKFALAGSRSKSLPVWLLAPGEIATQKEIGDTAKAWAKANGFDGQASRLLRVPDSDGSIAEILFGIGKDHSPFHVGKLANELEKGAYHFANQPDDAHHACLGWLLGAYRFTRYNDKDQCAARLVLPKGVDQNNLETEAGACYLARDLINTPANDMGPQELEDAVRKLGREHKARVTVIKGDKLLENNFPMIHAVGRASDNAPRLIDLTWGSKDYPKVTLVGKGVIFDTGGLNIKPGASMALMKKDMGGAANTIALAQMVMMAKLPVRLRLLVPAVENAISGNAFRPGDILSSRKGMTVEIGNTDAEGRLILGDALAYGDEESPDLMVDMATLTGAARVALGPDLPPFYTHDDELADALAGAGQSRHDPLWRMPLWKPYQKMLSSRVADVNHISTGGFAGSITAALFLSRFVENAGSWAHFDIYGWNPSSKPWSSIGGEAQGIRALLEVLTKRYG